MAIRIVTPPAAEPVTLAEAKEHLEILHNDRDDYISGLIAVAREHLEWATHRALVSRTLELVLDTFPYWEIELPVNPVLSISNVKYDDVDGNEQTVDAANYYLDNVREPGWLLPIEGFSWPATINAANSMRVQFIAGYASGTDSPPDLAENVPEAAKHAIKFLIGSWFENREPMSKDQLFPVDKSFDVLASQLRIYR